MVAAAVASPTEIEVSFADGERRRFDVSALLDVGLFQALRDPECFRRVRVSFGAVAWPGGLALPAETLYLRGRPVPAAGATAADAALAE